VLEILNGDGSEDNTGNLMFVIHVRRGVIGAMQWCLKGCWEKLVQCPPYIFTKYKEH
jgi:hypothetical protein